MVNTCPTGMSEKKKIHLTVTQVCRLHLCVHPGQKRLICLFSAKVVGQPSFFHRMARSLTKANQEIH